MLCMTLGKKVHQAATLDASIERLETQTQYKNQRCLRNQKHKKKSLKKRKAKRFVILCLFFLKVIAQQTQNKLMLRGWNDFSPLFLHLVTFLQFGTPLGHEQTLQPQGLQEKRPNVKLTHIKNNFRKNCRLLTKSHKNLNTMLSLCKYYIYIIYAGHYVGTIPLQPQSRNGYSRPTNRQIFFIGTIL